MGKLKCPECGKRFMKIVRGSETPTMLECPKCGEYAYTIGGILCLKTAHFNDTSHHSLTYEQVSEALSPKPKPKTGE